MRSRTQQFDAASLRGRMLEAERAAVRCREKGMDQLADMWTGRALVLARMAQKIEAAPGA
jgi:hypothetical protein